jgi:type 1 glutamine amidotransferase
MSEEPRQSYDVFISYSSRDKQWANAACAVLERNRIRCWIAPRDILPGSEWGASIISGIDACKIIVLIFSDHANTSAQVRREVERAISKGVTVLPCRVEDIAPSGALEYALGNTHWLDAFTPPVERQMVLLAPSVKTLLGDPASTQNTIGIEAEPPPSVRMSLNPRVLAVIAGLFMLAAGAAVGIMFTRSRPAEPVPEPSPASHARDNSSGPKVEAAQRVAFFNHKDGERAPSNLVKALIITGDNVQVHVWKDTTQVLADILEAGGKVKVEVTTAPSKDLTDGNLSKYDVLILNYKDTDKGAPESRWSDENKQAFLKAVREGKGLVVCHYASSAFTKPNWDEFEKAIAGGWRWRGYHGPKHVFTVKKAADHRVSHGLPAQFEHAIDELYQNSVMVPGSVVLATAYSDPAKPRGTGKDEPVIWVNSYGKGRVYENVLGHDTVAMADPQFQEWMRRGVLWAATGKVD